MEAVATPPEKLLYRQVKKIPVVELLKESYRPPKGKTHAIVEQTSKDILSFCSEDYRLRKNSEIYKPFEKLLEKTGIPFIRQVKVVDGNKFYVDYIIKQKIESNKISDILPRLSIWNSYDGTVKTQIKFGYHKMLCGNELSRPAGCQIHLSSKHSADKEEFSKETIAYFLDLFNEFLSETRSDIKMFEILHSERVKPIVIETIASYLKLSKEARDMAMSQLKKETAGGMIYINEKGKRVKHPGSPITLFMVYNALNYAIFHTNSKELPDFKAKKDTALIEIVCNKCKNIQKLKSTKSNS